jgi:hypothetical protein
VPVTIKERLHKLVDELSDAEASRARIVVEDERFLAKQRQLDARDTAEAYATAPQLAPDGWSDLAAVNETSRDAVLDRLAEEERAGGVKPW